MATQYQFGIRLSVDGEQEVVAATDKASRSFGDMGNVTDNLIGKLKGLAAAYIGAQTIQEFVKTADAMSLLDGRLRNAVGAGQAFAESQAEIYRIAQANNIGLQEAAQLYTKLYEPVKRLGGGTRETAAIVDAFATSMRVGGASAQEASAATLQFAQAMGSGKLQGDEFRSMAEASPRFMKALAEGMGEPIEKLKQMGTDGKLTADVVGNALIKSLAELKAEAAGLPDTVGGAFTRLKNEATLAVQAFDQTSKSTGTLADLVGNVAGLVSKFTGILKGTTAQANLAGNSFDTVGTAIRIVGTISETVLVLMSDISFMLKGLGREAGAVAAQLAAVMRGDFAAVGRIRDELIADNTRARAELDKYQVSVLGMTDKVMQQRDALRSNSLSAGENTAEQAKLSRQSAATGSAFVTLKSAVDDDSKSKEKAAQAAEKVRLSYYELVGGIQEKIAAMGSEETGSVKLNAAEQLRLKVYGDMSTKYAAFSPQQKIAIAQALDEWDAKLKLTDATKLAADATAAATKESEKALQAAEKKNQSLDEEISKLIASNAELAGNRGALADNTAEKYLASAAAAERAAMVALERNEDLAQYDALKRQAQAYRDLAALKADEVPLKIAKEARQEWEKTADSIYKGLTDSLFRAFESGKGFFKTLWEGIVNTFKTTVLRPTIEAVMKPVTSAVGSFFGIPTTAGASGGASGASGLGSLGSLASIGTSISGFGSGLGAGFSAILGEAGLSGGVSAGLTALGAGNVAGGLGTLAGSLGPYALAAVAAYMIADKLFGSKGGPKQESGFDTTGMGGVGALGNGAQAQSILGSVGALYSDYTAALGGAAGAFTGTAFFSQDPKGDALTQLVLDARLNGREVFSRNNRTSGGYVEDVGRTAEQFAAAVADAQTRALLASLQATTYADPTIAQAISAISTSGTAEQISSQIKAIADKKAADDAAVAAAAQAAAPSGIDSWSSSSVMSGITPTQYDDGVASVRTAVQELKAEVGSLKADNTAENTALAVLLKTMERILVRVSGGADNPGDALSVRTITP